MLKDVDKYKYVKTIEAKKPSSVKKLGESSYGDILLV
jgi:hypothetical protein